MFLSVGYCGSLVSFFAVNVYPSVPKSFEDMAKFMKSENLKEAICCNHILKSMKESSLDSFKLFTDPAYVGKILIYVHDLINSTKLLWFYPHVVLQSAPIPQQFYEGNVESE